MVPTTATAATWRLPNGTRVANTIPPRDGAVAWGDDHPRDAILQAIEAKGLAGWKKDSGDHRRSITENMMFRLKQLGDSPVLPDL